MGQRWEGFTSKIQWLREQLNDCKEQDLVVVTDSYDLVFQAGPERIVRDFTSYGKLIVFSSEISDGWPYENKILPETPYPLYRSLNAGLWVARVGVAKKIIDEAWKENICWGSIVDQGEFQKWYSVNRDKATVDYKNILVSTSQYPDHDFGYDGKGLIFNKHTGSIPCAIHGAAGCDMKRIYEMLKLPDKNGMISSEPSYCRYKAYMLAAHNPWSTVRPEMELSKGTFFDVVHERVFHRLLYDKVSVVLELGSGDGLGSTKFFLNKSDALLICIDTWGNGSLEIGEESRREGLSLYERFCSNLWSKRDRVASLRMDIRDGLRKIVEYDIIPDLIYIDTKNSHESMTKQLSLIYELFPASPIVGDGFNFPSVKQAVVDFARSRLLCLIIGDKVWMVRKS
jgi:hypothetical protein